LELHLSVDQIENRGGADVVLLRTNFRFSWPESNARGRRHRVTTASRKRDERAAWDVALDGSLTSD
jgi:hypothetical protein